MWFYYCRDERGEERAPLGLDTLYLFSILHTLDLDEDDDTDPAKN